MTTKIELRSTKSTGSDVHVVEGTPDELADRVNLALIADRIEAIWQE